MDPAPPACGRVVEELERVRAGRADAAADGRLLAVVAGMLDEAEDHLARAERRVVDDDGVQELFGELRRNAG